MLSSTSQKIHFVGVGGSGMSGIAEILSTMGFSVSGSDTKKGVITTRLQDMGVSVSFDHSSQNVHGKDLLVVSSAIQISNPEIIEAKNLNIPIVHRTDMLVELMRSKENIIVAGTHGKTTTTSILSHVLHCLGLDPTAVIGGQVHSFSSNAKFGQGKFFIAEADESDGSFLKLAPSAAIITNIDRDHLEYYGTLEEIYKAFEKFVAKVPEEGVVCGCIDDILTQKLLASIKGNVITYGLNSNALVTAKNICTNGFQTTFTPVIAGQEYPEVTIPMPGYYNVTNTLASFAIAYAFHLDISKIGEALSSFRGTLHRYTLLGTIGNHLIVDDYAHNPKKIETVLTGTKESFKDKNIVVIFQPHRYSRIKEQGDEFAKCFYYADHVILTPIYSAGEEPIEGATVDILANKIIEKSFENKSSYVQIANNFDHTIELCEEYLRRDPAVKLSDDRNNGTIFLTLGAGDISNLGHLLKERLSCEN